MEFGQRLVERRGYGMQTRHDENQTEREENSD
jgi:hypothetical protein